MAFGSALRRLLGRDPAADRDSEEATFRRVVENSVDVICRVVDGTFRYVSPSAVDVFGWRPEDIVGTDGMDRIYHGDRHIVMESIGRLVSGRQSQTINQVRSVCQDGTLKWVETTAQIDFSGGTMEIILVMRDISVRKKLEEELAALALQDGLTGLANRRAFDQALDLEWKRTLRTRGEMALVLLDIDCFKQFNDLYGHQAGDDCLRAVARCVRDLARRPGDTACRYGGEELVVILACTGLDGAVQVADGIRSQVAALAIPHPGSVCADHVTVSIGVAAAIARKGGSMELPYGLLQAADHALYRAKAGGRNRVDQAMLIAPVGQ